LLEIEAQAAQAYRAQRSADAVRLYTSLLEAVPEEPEYWYRLANSLVRTGRYGEAELAYQHLLGLQQDHARAWHNLGNVRGSSDAWHKYTHRMDAVQEEPEYW